MGTAVKTNQTMTTKNTSSACKSDYKAAAADPSTQCFRYQHQRYLANNLKKETVFFQKYACICSGTAPLYVYLENSIVKPE